MRCWRIDLQGYFMPYLDGELEPKAVRRLEAHLFDCGWCRTRLACLRSGQHFAKQMPHFTPQHDPWEAIEVSIKAEKATLAEKAIKRSRSSKRGKFYSNLPAFTGGLLILILLFGGVLLLNRRFSPNREKEALVLGSIDLEEFRVVNVDSIKQNTAPHIMAEGYVSELRKEKDGDITFKLIEDINRPKSFIFCEIISPIKLTPPPIGSRVRVYGVSRYDMEDEHNWYEVHPVLNIELVQR